MTSDRYEHEEIRNTMLNAVENQLTIAEVVKTEIEDVHLWKMENEIEQVY